MSEVERFKMEFQPEGAVHECVFAKDYDDAQSELARIKRISDNYHSLCVDGNIELTALREELAATKVFCAEKDDRMGAMNHGWACALEQRDDLQKRLTAAEQRNAIREDLLNQCMHAFNHVVGFSDQATRTAWYGNFLKPVTGAIMVHLSECAKPTESGAKELDPKIIGIVPMPPMEYDEP